MFSVFFFFNDTATTEIYTLSLHDALPIWADRLLFEPIAAPAPPTSRVGGAGAVSTCQARIFVLACWNSSSVSVRSEEHTSELQSQSNLVCRLLLEKKNNHVSTQFVAASHA